MHRKPSSVIVTVLAVLALVLAGCSKGVDLTKVKAQAFELLGTYGPKVSGLLGKAGDLSTRAQALPDSVPGKVRALQALRGQAANITKLKNLLDGYGARIETAAKTGKKAEVEQAMAAFTTEMDTGVAAATAELATVSKTVEAAEVEAKAAIATPDPTTPPAGTPAPTTPPAPTTLVPPAPIPANPPSGSVAPK